MNPRRLQRLTTASMTSAGGMNPMLRDICAGQVRDSTSRVHGWHPLLKRRTPTMGLVALLLILALIFGGVGLFVEGLKWLLIIAVVLFIASFFTGFRGRSTV